MPIPCPCSWSQGAVSKRSPSEGDTHHAHAHAKRPPPTWIRPHHMPPWRAISYGHAIGVMRRLAQPKPRAPGRGHRASAASAKRAKPRQGGYEPGKRYGEEPGSVSDFFDSYKYGRNIQLTPVTAGTESESISAVTGAAPTSTRSRETAVRSAASGDVAAGLVSAFAFRRLFAARGYGKRAVLGARSEGEPGTVGSRAEVQTRPSAPWPPATSHITSRYTDDRHQRAAFLIPSLTATMAQHQAVQAHRTVVQEPHASIACKARLSQSTECPAPSSTEFKSVLHRPTAS